MNKFFKSILGVAVFASLLTVYSCEKTCDAGYEGSDCKTEVREKIVASYDVTENCDTTGAASYTVAISKSSANVSTVLITPFAGYPAVTATVSVDGNSLTIADQTNAGYTYSGSGTINDNGASLSVTYTISDGTTSESCTGTWTKK